MLHLVHRNLIEIPNESEELYSGSQMGMSSPSPVGYRGELMPLEVPREEKLL